MKRIRPAKRWLSRACPAGSRGHRHSCLCVPTGSAPGGATLTEVLMSILVMGIGVLSVISLFPAAFLRTLQATNLTHATILRYNADSLIDVDPLNRLNVYPFWQAGRAYAVGDVVLADLSPRNNRRFRCTVAGTSGAAEPAPWDTTVGNTTGDNTCTWICEDHSRYVIDPLGWNVVGAAFQNALGNDGAAPSPATPLERFNAATTTIPLAEGLASLPDSWSQQFVGVASNPTTASVDLLNVDLTGVSYYNPAAPPAIIPPGSRVILTDATGKISHTRWITGIAGQTMSWTQPLPTTFTPAQVRVETQERRYTWILTVRRSLEGVPSVDVTVFFRRALVPTDERVFASSAGPQPNQLDLAHNPDGTQPAAKKGGYLLDVDNARWYRIQDSIAWNANTTRVTLDRNPIDAVANVVVPRGTVDVYPIGSK